MGSNTLQEHPGTIEMLEFCLRRLKHTSEPAELCEYHWLASGASIAIVSYDCLYIHMVLAIP